MGYDRILVTPTIVATITLLAFSGREASGTSQTPQGWFAAGSHPQNYEMSVDTQVTHSGKAGAHIKFIGAQAEGFGTLMQMFKADSYRGKRVRMSAWMKTADADSANLWLRVDGPEGMLGFDNMQNRAVRGTSEWKKYEVTLDVPSTAVNIGFGAFVAGKGQAWLDDFVLEVVGQDVDSTNMLSPEQHEEKHEMQPAKEYPMQPVNLNFEG